MSHPSYRRIAELRTKARELHSQGERLIEQARACWREISELEARPERKKPGEARSMRSIRHALRTAASSREVQNG